ncbi:MAG: hypothetical protein JWO79_4958 [Actinomycetia bacterium]|nr:hypothetical protein [Actinomycetes bacterium]MDQ1654426.1 hypothetical protein [Cryptosporangiaceae bacterium]MDQ1655447.1 hypothetical protein [Cryptosporangiaceae bacterium]
MARHSNAALDDRPTELYRPTQLEVRTRRAPTPPLWARACVWVGCLLLAYAILSFLVRVFT